MPQETRLDDELVEELVTIYEQEGRFLDEGL